MIPSRTIRRIFAIDRSFCAVRIVATPLFPKCRSTLMHQLEQQQRQYMPSVINTQLLHIRIHSFSTMTIMSDDEIRRRLDMFQDLYVVARDCMEDLVTAQGNEETNDEDDDDENDEFFQRVSFVQDSVQVAMKEYNKLLNDLNNNDEQKNRIIRTHGFKVKQLELELAMLLHNTNINDDNIDGEVENDGNDDDANDLDEVEDDDEEEGEDDDDDDEEEDHDDKRK